MTQATTARNHEGIAIRNRVLEIIVDGYGFDGLKEEEILSSVEAQLPEDVRLLVLKQAIELREKVGRREGNADLRRFVGQILSPVPGTCPCSDHARGPISDTTKRAIEAAKEELRAHPVGQRTVEDLIDELIRQESARQHYSIWAARTPFVFSLRQHYPTIITKTSGIAVGYEHLQPEVQGNSETGHQQIGNLVVAPQPPLAISLSIDTGEFYQNEALRGCVEEAARGPRHLDVTFLLSGEYGNDGRVHSAWDHLEGFLKLCFEEVHLEPSKLRIHAVLDGRDSPPSSSVEREGDRYGFLYKLGALLNRYGADEALAWVIGRSIAMDRDYDEVKAKANYELLTQAKGERVLGIQGAIDKIKELHARGYTDSYVEPLVVCDRNGNARRVVSGDVFVDLNFRSDRQRIVIASLLGAGDFLQREASLKAAEWNLAWLDRELKVVVCTMTEYHPELSSKYGAKVAFQTLPLQHNFLSIACRASEQLRFPFRYLLVAESSKALHVGYFIRGRREAIEIPGHEDRTIIPSYGREVGVRTDDDYFLTPQMKAFAVAGVVANEMYRRYHDLIIVNLSNPDMLGHLICQHFDETVEAIEVIDTVLGFIVPLALKLGFYVVLTSDHGNADEYGAEHGSHDVLTTFVSPKKDVALRGDLQRRAMLFDLSWSVLDIMGIREAVAGLMPDPPDVIRAQKLVGESLIVLGQ